MIDDCSIDDSFAIAQELARYDSRIKLLQLEKNSGAAVARNKGIEAAQGRYIAFLDSDDAWLPNKLEKQIAFMEENNYPFTYAAYDKVNVAGEVIGHISVPSQVAYNDLLKTNVIGCLTAIYDTIFFGKVYMPLIRRRQDLGLWLKLLKINKYAYGLNETLGLYKVREDSISSNKKTTAMYNWRLYRDIEKLNLLKASYYFSHYAVRGLLRSKFPRTAKALGIL